MIIVFSDPHLKDIVTWATAIAGGAYLMMQCRKPSGPIGRFVLWTMNRSHSQVTAWGLEHVHVRERDTIADIGCGGGRTIQRLSALARQGKVYGVDYAQTAVNAARHLNRAAIRSGHVEVQQSSAAALPFASDSLDLVTAVETHYYWPDLPKTMREILRVLKPGGTLLIIAEAYGGGRFDLPSRLFMKLLRSAYLTPEEHRQLFVDSGYAAAQVFLEPSKGWICATGTKSLPVADA